MRTPAAVMAAMLLGGLGASAAGDGGRFSAPLRPEQEVPVVSSDARGRITLDIDEDEQTIAYELSYSGLVTTVTQAHIHIAQRRVNGGIVLWLCQGTATSPLASTPACPQEGTVSGVLRPADVVAIGGANAGQQISAGEFDEVVDLIRKGLAYANVHTEASPGGEIRGQLQGGGRD
jgi:CHRD domain